MKRRQKNPLILLAAFVALAIGAWWQRDVAPVPQTAAPTARTAPQPGPSAAAAEPSGRATPAAAPAERRLTEPDGSGLEAVVPDDTERAELEKTLARIRQGGPFPHRQDGTVFQNREGRLPRQPRGYYHEYTVRTPGASNRGARRVVRGDGGELYYTRDHYRTFLRIDDVSPDAGTDEARQ